METNGIRLQLYRLNKISVKKLMLIQFLLTTFLKLIKTQVKYIEDVHWCQRNWQRKMEKKNRTDLDLFNSISVQPVRRILEINE